MTLIWSLRFFNWFLGVSEYLSTEICTSRQKRFSLVTFVDSPGLVDGDMKYPFDVDEVIMWLGEFCLSLYCSYQASLRFLWQLLLWVIVNGILYKIRGGEEKWNTVLYLFAFSQVNCSSHSFPCELNLIASKQTVDGFVIIFQWNHIVTMWWYCDMIPNSVSIRSKSKKGTSQIATVHF